MDFANLKNLQYQLNQALKMHSNPKFKVARNSSVWERLIFALKFVCVLGLILFLLLFIAWIRNLKHNLKHVCTGLI